LIDVCVFILYIIFGSRELDEAPRGSLFTGAGSSSLASLSPEAMEPAYLRAEFERLYCLSPE